MKQGFYQLLWQIQQKPGLYIGEPSINELYMFLQGYNFARRELKIVPSGEESEFREFQFWLQKKFNLQTSQSWSQLILLTSLNEQEGFYRFFELLEEFRHKHARSGYQVQVESLPMAA